MKSIVDRLHEKRQLELAKNILESNGYKVEKKLDEGLQWEEHEDILGRPWHITTDFSNLEIEIQKLYGDIDDDPVGYSIECYDTINDDTVYVAEFMHNSYDTLEDAKKAVEKYIESLGGVIKENQEVFDEELPEWQYIEYTDNGPETYVVKTEEEAQKAIDKLKEEGIETKGPTPITRQDESADEDEWSPYQGKKYKVYGSDPEDSVATDDPKEAIEAWFRLGEKSPTDTSIMTTKKEYAVELNKEATEEYLTSLKSKYRCPYKLEYLIDEAAKKVADGQRGFYEDQYGYGDSIHPFSVG